MMRAETLRPRAAFQPKKRVRLLQSKQSTTKREIIAMTDRPIELDERRGMAAQKATELRRRLHEVQADQAALRRRQDEFEQCALAAPSATWAEAAAKARYLIQLFAAAPEAQDPRRQELIAKVLAELAQLSD
jgi:hypothetical protein